MERRTDGRGDRQLTPPCSESLGRDDQDDAELPGQMILMLDLQAEQQGGGRGN